MRLPSLRTTGSKTVGATLGGGGTCVTQPPIATTPRANPMRLTDQPLPTVPRRDRRAPSALKHLLNAIKILTAMYFCGGQCHYIGHPGLNYKIVYATLSESV